MEIKIDLTQPIRTWYKIVPEEIDVLIGHITTNLPKQKFNFDRYYNKSGQKYYQSPIDVGPLFDVNCNTIGYLIYYKGYKIQIDNVLKEICIIR